MNATKGNLARVLFFFFSLVRLNLDFAAICSIYLVLACMAFSAKFQGHHLSPTVVPVTIVLLHMFKVTVGIPINLWATFVWLRLRNRRLTTCITAFISIIGYFQTVAIRECQEPRPSTVSSLPSCSARSPLKILPLTLLLLERYIQRASRLACLLSCSLVVKKEGMRRGENMTTSQK